MRSIVLGSLSVLLLAATGTPAVRSEPVAINSATLNNTFAGITPFNLFTFANRGYLKAEGIPSYQVLRDAYVQRQITAKDIVAAAVKANMLPQQYLKDEGYISAVDGQLRATVSNN